MPHTFSYTKPTAPYSSGLLPPKEERVGTVSGFFPSAFRGYYDVRGQCPRSQFIVPVGTETWSQLGIQSSPTFEDLYLSIGKAGNLTVTSHSLSLVRW